MSKNPRHRPGQPSGRGALSSLNALDLALQSQKMELETDAFLLKFLPLLDAVEKLCRGLDQEAPEEIVGRAESLALLADIAEDATAEIGLERSGVIGESVDRAKHEVADTVAGSEHEHGTVLEVLRYGWLLEGRILRQASVVASIDAVHEGRTEQLEEKQTEDK